MLRFAFLLALSAATGAARAQLQLRTEQVIPQWLDQPVFLASPPGDTHRLFVLERPGAVRVIQDGVLLPAPFLDLHDAVQSGEGEQGLLGLAFAPDYAASGRFYVSYTGPAPQGDTVIERYSVSGGNPNLAVRQSAQLVLRIARNNGFHVGGWIGFGPDGFLYIASGDDGTGCSGSPIPQSTNNLLAKILRIDVSGLPYSIPAGNPYAAGGGAPEVWAYGLRNPWRNSFDRLTGDFWIADVGADEQEEINVQPAASAILQAANYGWDCREGFICAPCSPPSCPAGCMSPLFREPIHVLPHSTPVCALIGGAVYRGCAIPELRGAYFFSDFCYGRVWSLRYENGVVTELTDWTSQLAPPGWTNVGYPTSFGEDAQGELYITEAGKGLIFRIIPAVPPPDCNGNGRPDGCDIASGYSTDNNANGIPDECDCYANCNGSYSGAAPTLTIADFSCFQNKFVLAHPYADCNHDGQLTVSDFACFQTKFVQGCP